MLHTCFLPPGLNAADAPFVTLHSTDCTTPCCYRPVTMPDTDTAFGEYTAHHSNDALTYSAGTVLMRPRSVLPSTVQADGTDNQWSTDTPVFIVFKPCAASLLRGAVPVGTVLFCSQNDAYCSAFDIDYHETPPFTEERIRWFESQCAAGPCSVTHPASL